MNEECNEMSASLLLYLPYKGEMMSRPLWGIKRNGRIITFLTFLTTKEDAIY